MEELRNFAGALRVGGVIVYPLLLLAVLSTIVILEKAYVFVARARMPAGVMRSIGADGVAWAAFEQTLAGVDPRNYFGRFCRVIVDHRKRPPWWIESRAADEASAIEQSLGRGLWILETTVTAAPPRPRPPRRSARRSRARARRAARAARPAARPAPPPSGSGGCRRRA